MKGTKEAYLVEAIGALEFLRRVGLHGHGERMNLWACWLALLSYPWRKEGQPLLSQLQGGLQGAGNVVKVAKEDAQPVQHRVREK